MIWKKSRLSAFLILSGVVLSLTGCVNVPLCICPENTSSKNLTISFAEGKSCDHIAKVVSVSFVIWKSDGSNEPGWGIRSSYNGFPLSKLKYGDVPTGFSGIPKTAPQLIPGDEIDIRANSILSTGEKKITLID